MARRLTRFRVGKQRLPTTTRPSEANYTRVIRGQMEEIEHTITQIVKDIADATEEAIEFGLLPIYERSQELVPVATHTLKSSGFIKTRKTEHGVGGEVGYAKGGNPHYAVFVHEMVDIPHTPPTQAKFLEQAVNEKIDDIGPRIVQFMRQELGLS